MLLGATIHDVAQVVGAGYAVSETVGNTAVIVKLFRVFLLLPVVLAIGWWFARKAASATASSVPVPVFAFVFLALCVVNSIAPSIAAVAPLYAAVKSVLVEVSTAGLLIAIAALGLGTSVAAIGRLGWRHIVTVSATTLVILAVVTGALPAPGRPLIAATYNVPLSSKRSVRISWNGESSSTNGFPLGSSLSTRPGEPVPTSRLPSLSKVSAAAWVAFVL